MKEVPIWEDIGKTNSSLQDCSIGISPSRRSARTVPDACIHAFYSAVYGWTEVSLSLYKIIAHSLQILFFGIDNLSQSIYFNERNYTKR